MITKDDCSASMLKACTIYCLSTDTKPTDVGNASILYEMDTKKMFMFDAQNGVWLEQ